MIIKERNHLIRDLMQIIKEVYYHIGLNSILMVKQIKDSYLHHIKAMKYFMERREMTHNLKRNLTYNRW